MDPMREIVDRVRDFTVERSLTAEITTVTVAIDSSIRGCIHLMGKYALCDVGDSANNIPRPRCIHPFRRAL